MNGGGIKSVAQVTAAFQMTRDNFNGWCLAIKYGRPLCRKRQIAREDKAYRCPKISMHQGLKVFAPS